MNEHKRKPDGYLDERELHPETLMMGYGYVPAWSEGAIKPPIFQSSTFVLESAEAGKRFFSVAYGLEQAVPDENLGLIYGRINNPNLEILEDRLTLWDRANACCAFASGMAAITTTLFEFLSPGNILLHSGSLYGGTDHFIKHVLPRFGVTPISFGIDDGPDEIEAMLKEAGNPEDLAMIYVETPANPTNLLVDIEGCASVAEKYSTEDRQVVVAVDNTFLGPLFQQPLMQGADLVLYSATKVIGGHSDVVAGACLGSKELIARVRTMRTFMGTMADPWTCWLILRSLETLQQRMNGMNKNAKVVANFLKDHPKIEKVHYLGFLQKDDPQYAIYQKQCLEPGTMISFDVKGGEGEAFRFLNALTIVKLAVSLGGTESLAEHPASMTHADVKPEDQRKVGLTDKMIRMSVGLEHPEDLIADIDRALTAI